MKKTKNKLLLFLLPFFFFFSNLKAQTAGFNEAISLFNNHKYSEASVIFRTLRANNEADLSDVANIFYIKCLLKQNELESAFKEIEKYYIKYPSSLNTDEVQICLADLYFIKEDYLNAAVSLMKLVENDSSNYAKEKFDAIVLNYFSDDLLKILKDSLQQKKYIPIYNIAAAKYYIKHNRIDESIDLLKDIKLYYSGSRFIPEAENLLKEYENHFLICALLPINSKDEIILSEADDILKGIKLAIDMYNKENIIKAGLVVKSVGINEDYKKLKAELSNLTGLSVIIGPIYSGDLKKMSGELKDFHIPIISPTATDYELTSLFKNFYQANVPFELRAKAMANYVFSVENKRQMAVIYPTLKYGEILAKHFKEEFELLGGKIVYTIAYRSGSFFYEDMYERLLLQPLEYDGIYCPIIDKADGPSILNLFNQANIFKPVYGDQDWSLVNPQIFKEYTGSVIITSDYYIDILDRDYRNFYHEYAKYYSKQIKKNSLYGYDVVNFVLKEVGLKNLRKKIYELEGKYFKGIHNNIKFMNRINHIINILRLTENNFELIDKYEIK